LSLLPGLRRSKCVRMTRLRCATPRGDIQDMPNCPPFDESQFPDAMYGLGLQPVGHVRTLRPNDYCCSQTLHVTRHHMCVHHRVLHPPSVGGQASGEPRNPDSSSIAQGVTDWSSGDVPWASACRILFQAFSRKPRIVGCNGGH
jgi:hypothetical protein